MVELAGGEGRCCPWELRLNRPSTALDIFSACSRSGGLSIFKIGELVVLGCNP